MAKKRRSTFASETLYWRLDLFPIQSRGHFTRHLESKSIPSKCLISLHQMPTFSILPNAFCVYIIPNAMSLSKDTFFKRFHGDALCAIALALIQFKHHEKSQTKTKWSVSYICNSLGNITNLRKKVYSSILNFKVESCYLESGLDRDARQCGCHGWLTDGLPFSSFYRIRGPYCRRDPHCRRGKAGPWSTVDPWRRNHAFEAV
ncbi:hypothetical protein DFS34DRAFT_308137 [Phlyctochytrium arcticum]|nr:hypothetical protein DFS34DRAFT_308137 [Phlyctochytrium arcticum]